MNTPRREFLRQSGLAAAAISVVPSVLISQVSPSGEAGDPILKILTEINDGLIEDLLSSQVDLPGDRWDGGVADRFEVISINSTVGFTGRLANSYASPSSQYYLSSRLEAPMEKMPGEKRAMSELQTLNYRVEIAEPDGKVSIDIRIEGTPHVPVSLEMSFHSGGKLKGVVADKNLDGAYFLENGMGQYEQSGDVITFGPGIAEHKWAEIRGMLPKQNEESVHLTGFTPFRHTLHLK